MSKEQRLTVSQDAGGWERVITKGKRFEKVPERKTTPDPRWSLTSPLLALPTLYSDTKSSGNVNSRN